MTPRLLGPWLLLLVGVLVAVLVVVSGHLRGGGYLLGGTLGVTALLRALLPERLAGAVVVRARWLDVLLLGGACAVALVLAGTLPLATTP
ncbi:DUF3017 domain-containing protein [Angustibacter aerolatus]